MTKSNPNQLDPATEMFSSLVLLELEGQEQQGKADYPALYKELTTLSAAFLKDPKLRIKREFLRIVALMRFFGIYPEERWQKNQWRLDKVKMPAEQCANLKSGEQKKWLFWQPPNPEGDRK